MNHSSSWPDAWVRAALGTAILATLEAGPRHGYAIAVELESRGFGRPRGGSLYPLLSKLEEAGAVVAHWEQGASGPGRRSYRLTESGRVRLTSEREQWSALTRALGEPSSRTAAPSRTAPGPDSAAGTPTTTIS